MNVLLGREQQSKLSSDPPDRLQDILSQTYCHCLMEAHR